jgi:hypothetical protein
MATMNALIDPDPGTAYGDSTPRCRCGSEEFVIVYKAPFRVRVVEGLVASVDVARDCHEGPIVAECERCGRSDVDDEEDGCVSARELANAAAPWSAIGVGTR